jgi:predicted transcriptional regulator
MRLISREGGEAKPTRILYGANLSYERLVKYLDQLKAKGLIVEVKNENHVVYKITEKGVKFLNEFRKVEEFAEAFGFII